MNKILLLFLLALGCGLLYKLGGLHGNWKRRIGVPLLISVSLWLVHPSLWIAPTAILLYASLTTYWTPKSYPDVLWWGYYLSGLGISLAFFSYAMAVHRMIPFYILIALMPILFCGFTVWLNKTRFAGWSEVVRGIIIGIIPFIFI